MMRGVIYVRITLKDIAKATDLSVTTVSLALNNKGSRITDETREKVLKTAKELGYRSNQMAIDLQKGSTNTLGLIVPDISNDFYATFAKGVEEICRGNNWVLILCNSDNQISREIEYIDFLYRKNVDGIILASAPDDEDLANESLKCLAEMNIPHVLLDFTGTEKGNIVTGDHFTGGYAATEHLIKLGHKKIACLTGPLFLEGVKSKLRGYQEALRENGLYFDETLVYECDYTYEKGIAISEEMTLSDFTAVFAFNDLMALAFCNTARSKGYMVPDNYSVVGYDDVFFSKLMTPSLTTMGQKFQQMGREAAKILIDFSKHETKERVIKWFTPQLIVRESTTFLIN